MSSRLGSALAAGGISSVPKVTWANLIAQNSPGKSVNTSGGHPIDGSSNRDVRYSDAKGQRHGDVL